MRRSLFSRIFFTQVATALTVIIIITPTIFIMIGNYVVNSQKTDILQDAMHASYISEKVAEQTNNESMWSFYKIGIEYIGSKSAIIVLNADGNIIAAPEKIDGVNYTAIDKSFIEPVRSGKNAIQLYNKGKIFSEQTMVAIVPIMKTDAITGKKSFLGAAAALRSLPQIRYIQRNIVAIITLAQLVAWLVAFMVSYIITRQITNPIKKMRVAAQSIASGNFKERIPITSHDEIGQLASSFNSMTEALSELETMRSSFVSDVSHELRTPMTVISGFVEGIVDGTIPESEHKKYLGIVLSETKRLSRLVSELLEASRLESGKVVLNKKNIDLNRLVTETVITYEQALSQKNIDVSLNLESGECIAFADRDGIKRVLINLIDNAIKFTPENGKIMLSTAYDGQKTVTSVQNSGAGISQAELRHIWERFYKTDKSRSMDKKGVGLGLHIVKTIIANHSGKIEVQSVENEYTRFTFTLDAGEKNKIADNNGKDDKNER